MKTVEELAAELSEYDKTTDTTMPYSVPVARELIRLENRIEQVSAMDKDRELRELGARCTALEKQVKQAFTEIVQLEHNPEVKGVTLEDLERLKVILT